MRKLTIAAVVTVAVFAAMSAQAQNWVWEGGAEPQNWTNPAAWSGGPGGDYPGHTNAHGVRGAFGAVPLTDLTIDSVIPTVIEPWSNLGLHAGNELTLRVISGGSVTINNVWFGRNLGTGHLIVGGGSFLNNSGTVFIGEGGSGVTTGTFHVLGGGQMIVGSTLQLGGNSTESSATGVIDDGLVHVQNLTIRNPGDNENITLNHLDAIFRLSGNQVGTIEGFIANTGLRAGAGLELKYEWNDGENYTEVRAIPEPGTIALLGLAGLALLIRRRLMRG